MFKSPNGISQPVAILTIDWSQFIQSSGISVARLRTALDQCAAAFYAAGGSRYPGALTYTRSADGVTLSASEPFTSNTVIITGATGLVVAPGATRALVAKAPAHQITTAIDVPVQRGVWVSTTAGDYLAAKITCIGLRAEATAKPDNAALATRAARAENQAALLGESLNSGFLPTKIYNGYSDGPDFSVSTPGYAWPAASAAEFPITSISSSLLTSTFGHLLDGQQPSELVADLSRAIAQHRFGVRVGRIASAEVSPTMKQTIRANYDALGALPLFAMDLVGAPGATMDVNTLTGAITAVLARLSKEADTEILISMEDTPRSIGEWMFKMTGVAAARFYDSVDAIYRRKHLPEIPPSVDATTASLLLKVHPALIDGVSITGDRTVSVGGTTLTYPDPMNTGFTLAPPTDDARAALVTFNDFCAFIAQEALGQGRTSPYVLKIAGLPTFSTGTTYSVKS